MLISCSLHCSHVQHGSEHGPGVATRPRGHRAVAPGAAKSEGVDEAKLDNALLHDVLCTRGHRCSNPR